MSTRREAREIAQALALSTQEYARIRPASADQQDRRHNGSASAEHPSRDTSSGSGPGPGSGSGLASGDRSKDTEDSRELEIRPVTSTAIAMEPSDRMRPPESILPAWSSSLATGKSKMVDSSTSALSTLPLYPRSLHSDQSPIQSFTPSSSAPRPPPNAQRSHVAEITPSSSILPPRPLPSSFQVTAPASTPAYDPNNRSAESDTPSGPLFSPTQVSAAAGARSRAATQRQGDGDAAETAGTGEGDTGRAEIEAEDEDESLPGSPIQASNESERQFTRFVMSPDLEEEDEPIEGRTPAATNPSGEERSVPAPAARVHQLKKAAGTEVVIPRSASTSKLQDTTSTGISTPVAARKGPVTAPSTGRQPDVAMIAPSSADTTTAPAEAGITERSGGPSKRRHSPDPLAITPRQKTSANTSRTASTIAYIAPPAPPVQPIPDASAASVATPNSTGRSDGNGSRKRPSASDNTAATPRASSRQADQKAKEDAEKAANLAKKQAEREKRQAEKTAEEDALVRELGPVEVIRKQPSRAERNSARSGRQKDQVDGSRRSSRGQSTAAADSSRRRARSESEDPLAGSQITELDDLVSPQKSTEARASTKTANRKAATTMPSDPPSRRLRSTSPTILKTTAVRSTAADPPPGVRTYTKRGQSTSMQPIAITSDEEEDDGENGDEEDGEQGENVSGDDEVVELPQTSKRGAHPATQSGPNKRQKPGIRTSPVKSAAGRAGAARGTKRVLSDEEDAEDGEDGNGQKDRNAGEGVEETAASSSKKGAKGKAKVKSKAPVSKAKGAKRLKVVESEDEEEEQEDGADGDDPSGAKEEQDAVAERSPQDPESSKGGEASKERGQAATSSPKRSPLQSIPAGMNRPVAAASPSAALASAAGGPSKPASLAPGGVKWRTQRTDLASVLAKFGGHKPLGMSRRTKIVSLHQTIGPPKKALPPAPKKPERKKKGESDDEDDDDDEDGDGYESDGEGGRRKKKKEKGMEWYMVED